MSVFHIGTYCLSSASEASWASCMTRIHYSALCSAPSVSVSVSPLSYLSTLLTSPAHLQPSSMHPSLHWKRE
jgi:hypothetical protein